MTTDHDIDRRILRMVQLCVSKIDANPDLLNVLRDNVSRIANPRIRAEWETLLKMPWHDLKARLLAETEAGNALRQNASLGGIMTEPERLQFFTNGPAN